MASLWLFALLGAVQTLSAQGRAVQRDPRWTAITRVFGQDGEVHDGYFGGRITVGGVGVKSSGVLETASEVVFQQFGVALVWHGRRRDVGARRGGRAGKDAQRPHVSA